MIHASPCTVARNFRSLWRKISMSSLLTTIAGSMLIAFCVLFILLDSYYEDVRYPFHKIGFDATFLGAGVLCIMTGFSGVVLGKCAQNGSVSAFLYLFPLAWVVFCTQIGMVITIVLGVAFVTDNWLNSKDAVAEMERSSYYAMMLCIVMSLLACVGTAFQYRISERLRKIYDNLKHAQNMEECTRLTPMGSERLIYPCTCGECATCETKSKPISLAGQDLAAAPYPGLAMTPGGPVLMGSRISMGPAISLGSAHSTGSGLSIATGGSLGPGIMLGPQGAAAQAALQQQVAQMHPIQRSSLQSIQ